MFRFRTLAAAILLLVSQNVLAEGPIVAVFDTDDQGSGLDRTLLTRLTDYLATRLTEGGYRIIPRSQVKQRLLEAKKESYKECYDQGCQIELGRELAAQKTLATTILKIGGSCQLTSVLYDLKKSTTELAASAEAPCDEKELLGAVKQIAAKLSKPLSEGEISSEAAKETLQVMARLEQLKKEKKKLEEEAQAAEDKRKVEERKQKELAAKAEQAKQEAEQAKKEAAAARAEAEASKTFWARFTDSLRFEIEVHGALWGNEFVGTEGGYYDSAAEVDHNEILLYPGTQTNPDDPDAFIRGHKDKGQMGVGGRLGLRMMKYHTIFVIVDYIWQDWVGDTRNGQLADWYVEFGVLRVAGGYRFSYPVLSWLEPYAELAIGAHIYFPAEYDRHVGDPVELEPQDESPLAVMLGAGVRFSFLDHFFVIMGYLYDLPIGDLTTSSFLAGAGAYF